MHFSFLIICDWSCNSAASHNFVAYRLTPDSGTQLMPRRGSNFLNNRFSDEGRCCLFHNDRSSQDGPGYRFHNDSCTRILQNCQTLSNEASPTTRCRALPPPHKEYTEVQTYNNHNYRYGAVATSRFGPFWFFEGFRGLFWR